MTQPATRPGFLATCALLLGLAASGQAAAQEFTFDGDDLDASWQVVRPDPEAYIVEGGELLIVTASQGSYADETAANVFEYTLEDPGGDWTAEIVVNAELQTSREAIYLGVASDKTGSAILASLSTAGDQYYGWFLNVGIAKVAGDKTASFSKTMASLGCNVCGADHMFPNFVDTLAQPITLQLVKDGRNFRARARLGGPNDAWVETEKVTLLRGAPKLVLYASQTDSTPGETLFHVDKLTITGN